MLAPVQPRGLAAMQRKCHGAAMQGVRMTTISTAITVGVLLTATIALGHAETYTGTMGTQTATVAAEPTFTVAVGPMLGVPIGDHAFENKTGPGLFVAGTVHIADRFSFIARFAFNNTPSQQAAGAAVDRRATTLDAGLRYTLPSASPIRMIVGAMGGKHFSTPLTGSLATESGFGFHLEVGAEYVLYRNFAAVGSVGYSYAWTKRQQQFGTVDFAFEILDFSLGVQARF